MKKSISLLMAMALLMLCFSSCTMPSIPAPPKPTIAPTSDIAKEFLSAMAKGLSQRFNDDRDIVEMTDEEIGAYYSQLVNYELIEISRFSDVVFPDPAFDQLVHNYIDACNRQLAATEFAGSDAEWMFSEWNQGYISRAGIIVQLYDEYGLQISQEMIDNYRLSDNTLEGFAADFSTVLNDEFSGQGISCLLEVSDQGILILRLWIEGAASEAYFASRGNTETLNGYIEGLKEIASQSTEFQSVINDALTGLGLPATEVELHLMNDVSPEKTIAIVKKGQVIYDTVTGIDLRSVGSDLS